MKHISGTLSMPEAASVQLVAPQEQRSLSSQQTILTMVGVLMVMLLASLDQTVVSTAMPRVIADLHGFDRYTWVTTAYMLTSTVTVPIYGELSDLFGRKPLLLFGIVVFLGGSALSGASQSMNELIAFRSLQGIGAGALMPIAFAVVGDLFTPRERARWQGIVGAVFGLSSVIGPAVGGWITQNATWRWVFYVNLPIGIIALLVLIFLMPLLRPSKEHVSIDYTGAVLLVVGAVPLLLGFTWAGSTYPWLSLQILGLFTPAVIALVLFFWYEARLEQRGGAPILAPSLFKNSIFAVSMLVTFLFGMAMFGCISFIPLFEQGVVGVSATSSGLILTPMMLTSVVASVIVGQIVARLGRYKWLAVIGMAFSVGGTLLLLRLNAQASSTAVLWSMILFGVGLGFSMGLYALIVQNALPNAIGQATSSLTFFRSIGGTIGLAVMGSVLNATYQPAFNAALPASVKQALPARVIAAFNDPQVLLSPASQANIQSQAAQLGPNGTALLHTVLDAVRAALTTGIHSIFLLCTIVLCAALIALFFLKEIPLRGKSTAPAAAPSPSANVQPAPAQ